LYVVCWEVIDCMLSVTIALAFYNNNCNKITKAEILVIAAHVMNCKQKCNKEHHIQSGSETMHSA